MPYDRHNEVKLQRQAMASHAEQRGTAITVAEHTTAIALNTAKVTYDDAAQVATNTADIATNVTAIALNTAKVSYSTAASDAVALNTAKNSYPPVDAAAVAALPAGLSGFEARIAALEATQPKAFGRFTTVATPALLATSYNVASVSKTSTGVYAVVIDTDMTTANYTVMLSYEDSSATIQTVMASNIATTGFGVALRDASLNFSDASESVSFVVFENNT